ncbi:MAG: hypothetical protein POELPBGB_03185 [Bacteroidia bacterium]|nr:hypothetical protein [Bacteroidia bacterium]
MKQIIINIPENKLSFIIDLLKKFDFVKVVKQGEAGKGLKPGDDKEREEWAEIAKQGLAKAYGDDEPDYSDVQLKEPNPEYKSWKKDQW